MNEAPHRTAIPPIVKSLSVSLTPAVAFRLFTEGIDRWWPRATHSVSLERTRQVVFEDRVGGAVYEVRDDGARFEWGRVLAWDPPQGVRFSWYPGRDEATRQQVDVHFAPEGTGTRVTLVHGGWETLGERGSEVRGGYDTGWDLVLGEGYGRVCAEEAGGK